MWTFKETAQIAQDFGQWYALVTLEKEGIPQSFFLTFGADEPTPGQAEAAGVTLALQKNLAEAPRIEAVSDSVTRQFFYDRFTNAEIAKIYRVAEVNDDLFAYVKKLEINPTVNRANPDVLAGLQLLEASGLLAAGRANEILGW